VPSTPAVAEDDDSTSPHLNTFRIANEKAKKSELPDLRAISAMTISVSSRGGSGDDSDDVNDIGPHSNGGEEKASHEQEAFGDAVKPATMPEIIVGSTSHDEPPSCIPAHLYDSIRPNAPMNPYEPPLDAHEGQGHEGRPQVVVDAQRNGHDSGQATSTGFSSGQATHKGYSSGQATPTGYSSGQATPTGYDVTRQMPSSSIPHLLSASNSRLSADLHKLTQSQLSFAGIDAALTPIILSRDHSFAFSLDGDDSAIRAGHRVPTPPLGIALAHPHEQLINCLKQGLTSPQEASGSNLSSSVSLASSVCRSQNVPPNVVPSHPLSGVSPPQKVSRLQINVDMQLLSQPATSEIPPIKASLDQQVGAINAEVGKVLPEVAKYLHATKPPGEPPLPSHPLPRPYESNRIQKPSVVQPVLYSAINSLERYNAGSFDNKVMLAKARGTYGKQKAFPGVPNKKSDLSSSASISVDGMGTSIDSGLESKDSSVLSAMAGRGDSRTEGEEKVQGSLSRQDSALIEQVGSEQLVAITGQKSDGGRMIKSKSSGHLDNSGGQGTPESLGVLKKKRGKNKVNRSVTIDSEATSGRGGRRRHGEKQKAVGVFRPSSDAYTPRMTNRGPIKYKPAEERASVEKISSTMGTIQRPNFRDALRRVAIILHQHIVKIERRFSTGIRGVDDTGLFRASMREAFDEDNFATPRYKCSMVRVPMARPGVVYSMRKIRVVHETPTTDEIYEFAHQLFKKVQLSSECSIVCLIYVEKLMEVAKVPLVAETWRPIFMCGLLLASKVWQDLSSWNIEFASVYPQFSLDAINRLELSFLKFIKWDLYISSSLYAKYYFALRSLLEKSGFRDRYNQMVGGIGGIAASEAMKVSKRSEAMKEEALQQLSRSM